MKRNSNSKKRKLKTHLEKFEKKKKNIRKNFLVGM